MNPILKNHLGTFSERGYRMDPEFMDSFITQERILEIAEKLGVPQERMPEFVTYVREYLSNPFGCVRQDGPFFNDDALMGIREKFALFFEGILDTVNLNYAEPFIIIDPSYEEITHVAILALKDGKEHVLYYSSFWAWSFFFSPEELLEFFDEVKTIIEERTAAL